MNQAYRLVWNARAGTWVAVSEVSRGRGKAGGTASGAVRRAVLATGLLLTLNAFALDPGTVPQGGNVSAGTGSIATAGATVTINQASAKLAIDWQSFSVGSQASVTFNQPGASSVALNRVLGQDASQIMGRISAPGQVFLQNPNGVLFGSTAQVDVGGLLASTLKLSNADFMAGNYHFTGDSVAAVINQGTLTAANGGYVALLANSVKNEGLISARMGNVSLAAGSDITVNLNNGSLLGLTVNQGAVGALAQNSHLIHAEGGSVLMTAKAADQLVSAVVNNSGVIEARGAAVEDGVIRLLGDNNAGITINTGTLKAGTVEGSARSVLQAGDVDANNVRLGATYALVQTQDARIRAEGGDIRLDGGQNTYLSGTVDASGGNNKAGGGNITIAGQSVTLSATNIDASAASPGDAAGSIRVGGGAHGLATDINNATTVTVSGATSLKADGKQGSIVVWSDETTHYFGKAKAGEQGFIEVSSKGTLNLGGTTEVGAGGQILYDPTNIVIDAVAPSSFYIDLADPTPTVGDQHGTSATQLSGGNVAVASVGDDFGATNAGAVYLYNGTTGALISSLYGSTANDALGSGGITALSGGNYVVRSNSWNNGVATSAGAVTWGSGTVGVSGVVSSANSLVGSTASDGVGSSGITALSNGNYVVRSNLWDNGAATNAGAVTWGSGTAGVSGVVSSANSLVGSTANDQVGASGITALTNGNYVVASGSWKNGAATTAGAVTWGSGTAGVSGAVAAANSLVGTTANDQVGYNGVVALNNGNYTVASQYWDNATVVDAGAVTWGNGSTGIVGAVNASNSLVGTRAFDNVGAGGVTALTNGNYVASSYAWATSTTPEVGAATWGNGLTGTSGAVTSANSLIGSNYRDWVGFGITALTNGNYVVSSKLWDNGAASDAGAVTWRSGTSGVSGVVSAANSLVGSTTADSVGASGIVALTNGNYVVRSSTWTNGAIANAGAVTWGSGTSGVSGVVSAANSLVGSTAGDQVGSYGVTALTNSNYVVRSSNWSNGAATYAGAVTWGSGTAGVSGLVSSANSLVGSTTSDNVGSSYITALNNGNYVVASSGWDNGAIVNAGAVTWGSGIAGVSGVVSSANSLVGSKASDSLGNGGIQALTNGNYVVSSSVWDNAAIINAGAVTWGSGTTGVGGVVSSANSLVGSTANDQVGNLGVTALNNGSYVVRSNSWNNMGAASAGAVTWGSGTAGVSGAVSSANSLVGTTANDAVGNNGITALTNGNYVVSSSNWRNAGVAAAGAVTWGSGTAGMSGAVSAANSLVGTTANDQVSSNGVTALSNGNYAVLSPNVNGTRGAVWLVSDPANAATSINGASGTANVNPGLLANATGAGSTVTLQASNNITVNSAVSVAGKLNLLAGNAMTLNAGGTISSAAAGDAIVLSGNTFVNNAGSNALTATYGRWLVYSNAPAGNTFGGLTSGNSAVWNATYAGNAPATIASGNRYVFAQQPTVSVTANAQTKTYDGSGSAAPSYSSTGLINAATYGNVFTQDALTGALALGASANVGTYAIAQGSLAGPAGYAALAYTGANASITPKAVTITGIAATSRAYDAGTVAALTGGSVSGTVGGETLNFSGQAGQFNTKDVGTGKAVTVAGLALADGTGLASNYSVTQPVGVTGDITAKAVTVTGIAATARAYDAGTVAALTGGAVSGTVGGETLNFSGQSGQFNTKDVGTGKAVTVTGLALGDGTGLASNYSVTQPVGVTGDITAKAVTVTGLAATSRAYDAGTVAALTGGSVSGTVGGETLNFSGQSGQFDTKNVGTGKAVTVSGLGLADGTGLASNYSVTQPVGVTGDITAKAVTITGLAATSRAYDAGTVAALTGGSVAGTVGGETLNFSGQTGQFNNKDVGSGKAVTVTGLALGDGTGLASNYSVTQPVGVTGNITAKAVTITGMAATSRVYDAGTVAALTGGAVSGTVGGETLNFSGQTGQFNNKNVGTGKAVTVSGLALSDGTGLASNYSVTQPTGLTANITAKALTAGYTAQNKTFDGNTSATVTGSSADIVGADTVTFTQNAAFDTAASGNGKTVNVTSVALAGADAGNYALQNTSATATANIIATAATAATAATVNNTLNSPMFTTAVTFVPPPSESASATYLAAFNADTQAALATGGGGPVQLFGVEGSGLRDAAVSEE